jgi:hypothetical protein
MNRLSADPTVTSIVRNDIPSKISVSREVVNA